METIVYQMAASRTAADLGSVQSDSIHYVLGMNEEVAEILEAIEKKDLVNLIEELGDFCWFFFMYAKRNDLDIFKLNFKYNSSVISIGNSEHLVFKLLKSVKKITELTKKKFAYKKEISSLSQSDALLSIFNALLDFSYIEGINFNEVLKKNITKLYIRYPEKFSEDKALIRNLEGERLNLEKDFESK